jgi:hypothetical protein
MLIETVDTWGAVYLLFHVLFSHVCCLFTHFYSAVNIIGLPIFNETKGQIMVWYIFYCIMHLCCIKLCGMQIYLFNRPWRPIELWDIEAATFSRQLAHRWWLSCQPYVPADLYPQEDSWYFFLLEAELSPGPQCGGKD